MHKRKMIAPIIITVLFFLYFAGFAALCFLVEGVPLFAKLIGGGVLLLFAGVSIYVFLERIKEIRSGEEDDLSQY